MPTIDDLRTEIDNLDQQIITLLAQRAQIVHQIGSLKKTDEEVVAVDRQQQVYASRRVWAEQHDLDPNFVELLYKTMIGYFIEQERKQIAELKAENHQP